MRYGYQPSEEPVYIVCGDNARFMNHSDTPNCDDVDDLTIALVDIAEGDEITCDYARFDWRFAAAPVRRRLGVRVRRPVAGRSS